MPATRQFEIIASTIGDESVRALLDDIRAYLVRQEATNTIQLGGLGPGHPFSPDSLLIAARSGRRIAGVATLVGPYNLLLSHCDDPAVIDAIADAVVERNVAIPGVMGPVDAANRFADRWIERTGGAKAPGMTQRILETSEVHPPQGVPGTWREAGPDDHALLHAWFTAFVVEADDLPASGPPARVDAMLASVAESTGGGILWEDDHGTPVSIACFKAPTPNGIRIGPVYTPPAHRRRGYAAAVTAAATGLLLERGYAFVCLYTDATNLTANHVYESIGYGFVADSMIWRLREGVEHEPR